MRPRLLDLFCGAGGAAVGYWRAGFDVVGVDVIDQPRYPFAFVRADALALDADWLERFAVVHASPPCHDHSDLAGLHGGSGTGWMLAATVELLLPSPRPWVVENVVGPSTPLDGWTVNLCASSFGLPMWRHRRFVSNVALVAPPCRHELAPRPLDVTGTGGRQYRPRRARGGGRARKADVIEAKAAMGIDWMSHDELAQAIPPAYTELIGRQLLAAVT